LRQGVQRRTDDDLDPVVNTCAGEVGARDVGVRLLVLQSYDAARAMVL
jgi:hypothetical protein